MWHRIVLQLLSDLSVESAASLVFLTRTLKPEALASYEKRDRIIPPRLNWINPSSVLLRGVRLFETDVSGLPLGPIFKDQASGIAWPLEIGPTSNPETSVITQKTEEIFRKNYLTLCTRRQYSCIFIESSVLKCAGLSVSAHRDLFRRMPVTDIDPTSSKVISVYSFINIL
jgi:hypothetical protein